MSDVGMYSPPIGSNAGPPEDWQRDFDDSLRAQTESVSMAPAKKRIRLLSEADLETLPDPAPLIDGLLYREQLIAVVGRYGTFKTFLLIDWALSIALGLDWNGRRVTQGHVLYIVAEGVSGMKKRVKAWKAEKRYTDPLPISFLPTRLNISDPTEVSALIAETKEAQFSPVAIFVDTVARNSSGNENDGEDMKKFIAGCDRLKEYFGASVILAHHTGWAAERRSRGSTELPGALDTEIVLERDRDDSTVTLTNTKQKDAAEFSPITLEAVPCDGSLVLQPVVPNSSKLTPNERKALSVVQASEGLTSTEWMTLSGLAKGSYDNARKRLLALAYVGLRKSRYVVTDVGRLVAGTTYNVGTTDVQTSPPSEVQNAHTPKGVGVVLGSGSR